MLSMNLRIIFILLLTCIQKGFIILIVIENHYQQKGLHPFSFRQSESIKGIFFYLVQTICYQAAWV
jgi:hypothetical protein